MCQTSTTRRFFLATVTLASLAASSPAHADRRSFTHTYEYATAPAGTTDVELYSTQSRSTFDDGAAQGYQLQVEVEHGITDRFDVGLYHVFEQTSAADPALAEALHFHKVKARGRYRFAERGELPVDVLAYFELAKDFGASVYEIEGKAILARDFGPLLVAGNLIGAVEVGGDVDEPEVELGWAVGASYEVSSTVRAGVETYGGFEAEEVGDAAASVGPALAWGAGRNMWIAGTAGFGLTDTANAFDARVIVGLHL